MTAGGVVAVAAAELAKLAGQLKVSVLIAAAALSPFASAVPMRVQITVPSDTLFGRAVTDSGFAIPLVVLGFGALWPLPVLASLIAGDIFAAEDRHGTWTTILTRSRSRGE